jgi:dihydrofolate reductase
MNNIYLRPIISIIVAMAENRVIGNHNQLPWHLPADLKHFKDITTGSPILMGRKTYESIGRPLPNRTNIVMTSDNTFKAPGCIIVTGIEDAMMYAENNNVRELFIIGGATIYQQFLPKTDRIYLTIIHHAFEGDTYFPEIDLLKWTETSAETYTSDANNPYAYTFLVLDRKETKT